MSATLVEESSPPDRNTPKGTSDIIRLRTDSRSNRLTSSTISVSLISETGPETAVDDIGCHQVRWQTSPSADTVMHSPAASLLMPRNIVRGGGVNPKVR